jgi:hypothetical protein
MLFAMYVKRVQTEAEMGNAGSNPLGLMLSAHTTATAEQLGWTIAGVV